MDNLTKSPSWLSVEAQKGNLLPDAIKFYDAFRIELWEHDILNENNVKSFCHLCNGYLIYLQKKDAQDPEVRQQAVSMYRTISEKGMLMGIQISEQGMNIKQFVL